MKKNKEQYDHNDPRGIKKNLVEALKAVQADPNRETTQAFMYASARAFTSGIGLSGPQIDGCFDEVYGRQAFKATEMVAGQTYKLKEEQRRIPLKSTSELDTVTLGVVTGKDTFVFLSSEVKDYGFGHEERMHFFKVSFNDQDNVSKVGWLWFIEKNMPVVLFVKP